MASSSPLLTEPARTDRVWYNEGVTASGHMKILCDGSSVEAVMIPVEVLDSPFWKGPGRIGALAALVMLYRDCGAEFESCQQYVKDYTGIPYHTWRRYQAIWVESGFVRRPKSGHFKLYPFAEG